MTDNRDRAIAEIAAAIKPTAKGMHARTPEKAQHAQHAQQPSTRAGKSVADKRAVADTAATKPPVDPRPLTELLAAIEDQLRRYVVLPNDHAAKVLALWVAHTWAIEGATTTPYLTILSAEKQSGKTRLLETLEILAANVYRVSGAPSEAVLFRMLDSGITLMLDEMDALWAGNSERNEPIRAILNAGNRRGSTVPRCTGQRMDEVRHFSVFGAKVFAGIDNGKHPDTITDRALPITMRRKIIGEPLAEFDYDDANAEAEPLTDELDAWASDDTCRRLRAAKPNRPQGLSDRQAEGAKPLLAIADLAGGDWPHEARTAIVTLAAESSDETKSRGVLALTKIYEAFDDSLNVSTAELSAALNDDENLPFGAYRKGDGIDGRGLARLLKPYGIKPKGVRLGDGSTPKGYARDDFLDAWARYTDCGGSNRNMTPDPQRKPPHEQRDVADVADVAATEQAPAWEPDDDPETAPDDPDPPATDPTEATGRKCAPLDADELVGALAKAFDAKTVTRRKTAQATAEAEEIRF